MDIIAISLVKLAIAFALGGAAFYSADLLASPYFKNGARLAIGIGFGTLILAGSIAMMGTADLGAVG